MASQFVQSRCGVGCDPELFIAKGGKILGSEAAIPEGGVETKSHYGHQLGKIVRDGVQVELNPPASHCRAHVGIYIANALNTLNAKLSAEGMEIAEKSVVEIPREDLLAMSEKTRELGCGPSFNGYERSQIKLNGLEYRKRSAGGHIHLNVKPNDPVMFAKMCDFFCGNTSVLIDRDPLQRVRRKVYGRAGEFRLPAHGFEYRTLSNWWLRSYQTMSLAMGLARMAHSVCGGGYTNHNAYRNNTVEVGNKEQLDWILQRVDFALVERAINRNSVELATPTYGILKEFCKTFNTTLDSPIPSPHLNTFDYFIFKGLDHWFPGGILKNWASFDGNGHGTGWEAFLITKVHDQFLADTSYRSKL